MFGKNKLEKKIESVAHFDTDLEVGLTSSQVEQRNKEGLTNKIVKRVTKSYLKILYENLINPFNVLLYIIAILMITAKIDSLSSYVFVLVLVINISVGLFQDIRARKLIDKLKVLNYPKVRVLRDGKFKEIDANKIVLSDLVEIKSGNQIICDGTVVSGHIEVNESLLTGEPINILKQPGDSVFSGSFATSGKALFRVDQLGKANYAEKLQSKAKKFKKSKSEILSTISAIFKIIGSIVAVLSIILIFKYILKERPMWILTSKPSIAEFAIYKENVESISGSLVAMIPIGMYLLTTITLALGVIRLASQNMLTQDMYCIEMLARADVLCLDKTGTLTDGNMNVNKLIPIGKISERDIGKMLLTLVDATKDENPTANAIRKEYQHLNKFDTISAVPFNSLRKFSAVMLEDGRSVVLGAREYLPHINKKIDEMCAEYEEKGCRILVVGVQKKVIKVDEPLPDLDIIAILVLEDHIREDAYENINWFKENGVSIRIISGDNPNSVSEIARRAGIDGAEKKISLEGMPLEEVRHIARDYVIYGRVSPEQKEVIIQALKDDGHTVAMTGDGVNDILALRVADCSIAMASGSDAAKNVSHLVSLDSNFSSLPMVVKEGRRVINNLQRAISVFLVKTVFAIILTVVFIISEASGGPQYPFVTKNMLIWETINIGAGSLLLSFQPNEEQIRSNFKVNILFKVMPAALVQVALVLFFYILAGIPGNGINLHVAQTLSVVAFSIGSFIIMARVCMPFDAYRVLLVIGLGFVDMMILFSDFQSNMHIFGIDYSLLTSDNILLLIAALVGAIALYVFLEWAANLIHKKIDKQKEESKYENF